MIQNLKVGELKQVVRSLIKEAMADRIRSIDEAGDKAAIDAKIMHLQQEINQAEAAKAHIHGSASLREYSTKVDEMLEELDTNIFELNRRKEELENAKNGKPSKKAGTNPAQKSADRKAKGVNPKKPVAKTKK